ncbi:MAG: hypothetical protein ACYCS7_04195 [Acidimicrobiales bacterium]
MSAPTSPLAELSSLTSVIEETSRRVARMAEALSANKDDRATDLFAVERSLVAAQRRMARLIDSPRSREPQKS